MGWYQSSTCGGSDAGSRYGSGVWEARALGLVRVEAVLMIDLVFIAVRGITKIFHAKTTLSSELIVVKLAFLTAYHSCEDSASLLRR